MMLRRTTLPGGPADVAWNIRSRCQAWLWRWFRRLTCDTTILLRIVRPWCMVRPSTGALDRAGKPKLVLPRSQGW